MKPSNDGRIDSCTLLCQTGKHRTGFYQIYGQDQSVRTTYAKNVMKDDLLPLYQEEQTLLYEWVTSLPPRKGVSDHKCGAKNERPARSLSLNTRFQHSSSPEGVNCCVNVRGWRAKSNSMWELWAGSFCNWQAVQTGQSSDEARFYLNEFN